MLRGAGSVLSKESISCIRNSVRKNRGFATAVNTKLSERLAEGPGAILAAEGYVFALERRGYLQTGPWVPEVVLDDPGAVERLHDEFQRCGSDVQLALTYYGHRPRLRAIGKEELLEPLNRGALRLARKAADKGDNILMAGNICDTAMFGGSDFYAKDLSKKQVRAEVRGMFLEQLEWCKEEGADFIVAETFDFLEEAVLALECCKEVGFESVINLAIGSKGITSDGHDPVEAVVELGKQGAECAGLNCFRGPETMLPMLEDLMTKTDTPVAALPVPFRTNEENPSFQCFCTHDRPYTTLDPHTCTRYDMADFAKRAVEIGVQYVGVCCGADPFHVRAMAEAMGRTPPASQFSSRVDNEGKDFTEHGRRW